MVKKNSCITPTRGKDTLEQTGGTKRKFVICKHVHERQMVKNDRELKRDFKINC
jgi:hypothetical protein